MISQTAEYALRAVVWLAAADGQTQTSQQITASTQVPQDYLHKVLRALAAAGIVTAQRGPSGGYALALAPDQLTVLDVIDVVDPIQRITQCPLKLAAHSRQLCPLHLRLDEAYRLVEEAFAATAISELIKASRGRKPLCNITVADRPIRSPRKRKRGG